jgi:hypothetical protein
VGTLVWTWLLLPAVPGEAGAAGVREFPDGWIFSVDQVWALTAEGRPKLRGSVPDLLFQAGQGTLFGMPELPLKFLKVRARGRLAGVPWSGTASWQVLGRGVFRENRRRLMLLVDGPTAWGLGAEQETLALAGKNAPGRLALLGVVRHTLVRGGGHHLQVEWQFPLAERAAARSGLQQGWLLRAAFVGNGGAAAVQVDRRMDGTPLVGFDLLLGLDATTGISLRLDPASGSLGPGLHHRRGSLLLQTSHLLHPDLGQSHRLSLVVGVSRE